MNWVTFLEKLAKMNWVTFLENYLFSRSAVGSFFRYNFSKLLEFNIHNLNIQRIIDNNKVNHIVEYQLSYIKTILIFWYNQYS